MNRYARTSPSVHTEVKSIRRPFSNFEFLDEQGMAFSPFRRLLSQIRQFDGQTLVAEQLDAPDDLCEEDEDIRRRCPSFSPVRRLRWSFFNSVFTATEEIPDVDPDSFLGYAIIREDDFPQSGKRSRIYESVVRKSRHSNNYVHGERSWRCVVSGHTFSVAGYLYAQQNGVSNCCAHVALRTAAARFHPDGDMSYREMNRLLGLEDVDFRQPGIGVDTTRMPEVLKAAGATCFVGHYDDPALPPPAPFQKYIYGSIESGYPALVAFASS